MEQRTLGAGGIAVSAIGLGCMGMSEFYGPSDDAQSLDTLDHALDRGITLFDTADIYGRGHNERLLGQWLGRLPAERRDRVVLATKCGIVRSDDPTARGVSNSPAYIRACCDASLGRLGVEVIDLYYLHRIDPDVAIEESVGALAELVAAGKIRAIGLSEASADTLRRAHAVHPVAAVQSEYSLWARQGEAAVLPLCRDLGIAYVAYSPLGRGFLANRWESPEQLAPDDFRRRLPRFQGDRLAANRERAARLAQLAAAKGCTPAQLALAWLLAADGRVIPIPGTRRRERVDENAAAADLTINPEEKAALDALFPVDGDYGDRYAAEGMKLLQA